MSHGMQSSSEQKLKAIWELAGDAMVFLDAGRAARLQRRGAAALRHRFARTCDRTALCMPSRRRPRRMVGRRPRCSPRGDRRSSSRASSASIGNFSAPDGETLLLDVILHAVHMGGGRNRARNPPRHDGTATGGARARNCAVGGGKQPAAPVPAGRAYRTPQPYAVSRRRPAPDRRGPSAGPRLPAVHRCRQLQTGQRGAGGGSRRWRVARDRRTAAPLRRLGGSCWPAWAATNSPCCLPIAALMQPQRSPAAWSPSRNSRSRSAIIGSTSRSAWALPVLARRHRAWRA